MKLNEAQELLNNAEKRKQDENEAKQLISQEKEKARLQKEQEDIAKRKTENEAFVKRIPKQATRVYGVCSNCNKSVEMDNKMISITTSAIFRITECKSCGNYCIDTIDFANPMEDAKFLPYLLKIKPL